jgi:hypothetical protein
MNSKYAFNATSSAFATSAPTVSLADVYSGPQGVPKPSKKKSRATGSGQSTNNAQSRYV